MAVNPSSASLCKHLSLLPLSDWDVGSAWRCCFCAFKGKIHPNDNLLTHDAKDKCRPADVPHVPSTVVNPCRCAALLLALLHIQKLFFCCCFFWVFGLFFGGGGRLTKFTSNSSRCFSNLVEEKMQKKANLNISELTLGGCSPAKCLSKRTVG